MRPIPYALSMIGYALETAWIWAVWACWAVRLRWSSRAALQARIDRVRQDDPWDMHTSVGYAAALIGAGQRAGLYVDHL